MIILIMITLTIAAGVPLRLDVAADAVVARRLLEERVLLGLYMYISMNMILSITIVNAML